MAADKTKPVFDEAMIHETGSAEGDIFLRRLKICLLAIFYLAIALFQTRMKQQTILNGILSQFQVMISIYLAVRFLRTGFFVALLLNCIELMIIALAVLLMGAPNAITGVIVIFFTIISSSIIVTLAQRDARQFRKVIDQKKEITALYEEIAASEEELRHQNDQLLEYYQVIKRNEEKLNYLAYFDALTGLPNRKTILDRLELLVQLSHNKPMTFAVVFIDLDFFKKVNDTLGHYVGDRLIQTVGARLSERIDKNDLLGRLGGDEFAFIIQQELKEEEILKYVDSLRECLKEPFRIERTELNISASFGISLYPHDGVNPLELIRCADTAMYKAKNTGKNSIYFFRREMLEEILQKNEYENRLKSALQNNEFFLVFQPQYRAGTLKIRGFEALIRWRSPELGIVNPLRFIPLAEEMGLIIPLGEWIFRTACTQCKELFQRYRMTAMVSVNISAVQLEDPSFVGMVRSILADSGFAAQYLEFEITESVCIKSLAQTIRVLNELKAMGVQIALDDFGTEYSSLRYLQTLPIHTLKIDKSFIDDIDDQFDRKNIVASIISLMHNLGIAVIAEGVENEIQLKYLEHHGCDFIQGFLLGKPLAVEELYQLLDQVSVGFAFSQPNS